MKTHLKVNKHHIMKGNPMSNTKNDFFNPEEETILNASLEHSLLAILIDESSSMSIIQETADVAIKVFLEALHSFTDVSGVLDLAIGKYNHTYTLVQPFRAVCNSMTTYSITPGGGTNADIAIPAMLNEVQSYKHDVLRSNKVAYRRAFVFHITDGRSAGDLTEASVMVKNLEERKSIIFYTIAVPGASLEQIKLYTRPENIIDLTNEASKLDEVLPKVLAAAAVLSASSAGANSGSDMIAKTVDNDAATKAASILGEFGLVEK